MEFNINIQLLNEGIERLKGLTTELEGNPIVVPKKNGSGKAVEVMDNIAQEYEKMYCAILDLHKQTTTYFENVLDSFERVEAAASNVIRGRE